MEPNDFADIPDRKLNLIELALDAEGDRFERDMYRYLANGDIARAKDAESDAREHFAIMNEVKEARRSIRAEAR